MVVRLHRFMLYVAALIVFSGGVSHGHDLPLLDMDLSMMRPNSHHSGPTQNARPNITARTLTSRERADPADSSASLALEAVRAQYDAAAALATTYSAQLGVQQAIGRELVQWTKNLWLSAANTPEASTVEIAPPLPCETSDFGVGSFLAENLSESAATSRTGYYRSSFAEVYMPYDFAVRDWRFGQFSPQPLSETPWTAIAKLPKASLDAITANLELGIHIWNELECWGAVELTSMQLVAELTNDFTHRFCDFQRTSATSAVQLVSTYVAEAESEECLPYFTTPHLVVYELPGGKTILLTTEQAKDWQLVGQYQASGSHETSAEVAFWNLLQDNLGQLLSVRLQELSTTVDSWSRYAKAIMNQNSNALGIQRVAREPGAPKL